MIIYLKLIYASNSDEIRSVLMRTEELSSEEIDEMINHYDTDKVSI